MEKELKLGKGKAFLLIILSIAAVVVSQLIAMLAGNLLVMIGLPKLAGSITTALLYCILPLIGLHFVCKISKNRLSDFRISKIGVKPVWAISSFLMPLSVILSMMLLSGTWRMPVSDVKDSAVTIVSAVLFFLAVGVVEEAAFRGVIMGAVERISNKWVAIIVPSVLFGLLHIDFSYSILSCLQVIVAGTLVGILFSLVTYESGSIWSSALIHGIWDIAMSGGVLNISTEYDESYVFNYVLNSESFLITGGEFGVESSIFAIAAYLVFALLAIFLIVRKGRRDD